MAHSDHDHHAAHDHGHDHAHRHDQHTHAVSGHDHAHGAGGEHGHDHGHDHQHGHAHGHDHVHHHGPRGYVHMQRALALSIILNGAFVVAELIAAAKSGSLALDSDAAHNFGDVISLVFAWGATMLTRRRPSARFTYGLRGSTILAAMANGILLLAASIAIGWAAIGRLTDTPSVNGTIVITVAAIGVAVNALSAMFLAGHRHDDLNARGAFLHLAGDAALSLAVIISGILVRYTHQPIIDTAMSLALALIIVVSTLKLLAESLRLILQGVPSSIEPAQVERFLLSQPGVSAAHDLHIWAMSTAENAMTVHLVMPDGHPGDAFLAEVANQLDQRFKLGHATLQIETGPGCRACGLTADAI